MPPARTYLWLAYLFHIRFEFQSLRSLLRSRRASFYLLVHQRCLACSAMALDLKTGSCEFRSTSGRRLACSPEAEDRLLGSMLLPMDGRHSPSRAGLMFARQAQAVQRSQDTSPGEVYSHPAEGWEWFLIAVSILFNLLRKKVYPQAFKKIYIYIYYFWELYLHWIIIDYVHMCNHNVLPQASTKELLMIITFILLLINSIS